MREIKNNVRNNFVNVTWPKSADRQTGNGWKKWRCRQIKVKEIKYSILPAMGNIETHKRGTVKDLLFDVPYFFSDKDIIPPLAVLNDFLRKGIRDAGMSGGCR